MGPVLRRVRSDVAFMCMVGKDRIVSFVQKGSTSVQCEIKQATIRVPALYSFTQVSVHCNNANLASVENTVCIGSHPYLSKTNGGPFFHVSSLSASSEPAET